MEILCRFLTVHANVNAGRYNPTPCVHVSDRFTAFPDGTPSVAHSILNHLRGAEVWSQLLIQILTVGQAEWADKEGERDGLTGGEATAAAG